MMENVLAQIREKLTKIGSVLAKNIEKITDAIVRYTSKEKSIVLAEIFKLERGGHLTLGYTVLELPLFDEELHWVPCEEAETIYVLDLVCLKGRCAVFRKMPLEIVEKCNKKWDKCIRKNLDSITFKYTQYYD